MRQKINERLKRKKRVRAKVYGTQDRPRLSVFRSNKHIYAQIVDDAKGLTLISASDLELKMDKQSLLLRNKKTAPQKSQNKAENTTRTSLSSESPEHSELQEKYTKVDTARMVGELLAKKAIKKKVKKVVFDRGGYKYHGRVKALAEGTRKGGLNF